ncbi:MAG: hypothetical protein MUE72_13635 [Chitinophagaceae bacterium]|nr:hypothetical protein [Chitinophagaceae bacterium]
MNYEIGFNLSIYISLVIAILVLISFLYPFMYLVNRDYKLMTLYFPTVIGLSTFAILYPILNTFGQYEQMLDLLSDKENLKEIFTIRFTSILIGIKMFLSSMKSHLNFYSLLSFKKIRNKGHFVYDEHQTEAVLFNEWRNLAQQSIFIVTIGVIQFSIYNQQNESYLIIILNLVLFFIFDDWNIINDYMVKYQKEIIKSHKFRVDIANVILSIVTLISMWLFIDWRVSIILTLVLLLSIFWRYLYLPEHLVKILDLNNLTVSQKDRLGNIIIFPNDKNK